MTTPFVGKHTHVEGCSICCGGRAYTVVERLDRPGNRANLDAHAVLAEVMEGETDGILSSLRTAEQWTAYGSRVELALLSRGYELCETDTPPPHPFKDEWSFQRSMSKGNAVAGQALGPRQPCFTCGVPFSEHETPEPQVGR